MKSSAAPIYYNLFALYEAVADSNIYKEVVLVENAFTIGDSRGFTFNEAVLRLARERIFHGRLTYNLIAVSYDLKTNPQHDAFYPAFHGGEREPDEDGHRWMLIRQFDVPKWLVAPPTPYLPDPMARKPPMPSGKITINGKKP